VQKFWPPVDPNQLRAATELLETLQAAAEAPMNAQLRKQKKCVYSVIARPAPQRCCCSPWPLRDKAPTACPGAAMPAPEVSVLTIARAPRADHELPDAWSTRVAQVRAAVAVSCCKSRSRRQ